ncbi:permease [Companilactobacillus sp. RD055328]|uniref:FtsX-like permease family protein n=1 Tax=Companilactobacillus sp. RD055328 TaxID=2916634 RepID=UPI001FC8D563|nr:FtsX-like permease family protein [Companilactobacillus sp. RD055328]GKQ42432.1 permease [Companilactobacillus sp. RD055328]
MLNKLALSGIKNRLRDYSVLFSGLMISAAIFYMFMSLATNKDFLVKNSPSSVTSVIFGFGIVLLAIITLVYIVYANGFLLSMRQREYGMFMMLGARGSKISRMIFVETLVIGTISTLVGTLIGVGLTQVLSGWLIDTLNMQIKHFNAFYLPAVIYTLLFFVVIFAIAAMRNGISLRRTNVLKLLNSEKQPTRIKKVGLGKLIQAIIGVVSLGIGYYAMLHLAQGVYLYLATAVIGITLGTYLVINSLFSWIIKVLKSNKKYSMKKLNNFTLSQLGFRITDYTRILSVVAMLFALALGAITTGVGFKGLITKTTDSNNYYDAVVHDMNATQRKNVSKIDVKSQATYEYKTLKGGKTVVFNQDQFKQHNLKVKDYSKSINNVDSKVKYLNYNFSTKEQIENIQLTELWDQLPGAFEDLQAKVVSGDEYAKINAKSSTLTMIKSKDFYKNISAIKKVALYDAAHHYSSPFGQKYQNYQLASGIFSGLEFMGMFLGIAFLAMLASCLMFKILSGAASDVKRYEMMRKMGVRDGWLSQSIKKEIAVLFLIPGILGVIHVLVGLKMFGPLLPHPYEGIFYPFTGFFILYLMYYVITTMLYQRIVLKK